MAGVRRPDGEVLDTKGSGKYRESAVTAVLPRRLGDRGEYGGEVFGVKASWSSANSLPEKNKEQNNVRGSARTR
jgi:hypothetical protein